MSIFDVRTQEVEVIKAIHFADTEAQDGSWQAYRIESGHDGDIKVYDGGSDYVFVTSADHARNLIKALEKSIDLGWLK